MNSSDIDKFQRLMTGIAENFSATLSDAGTDLMFESLKMYSYEQVYKASIQVLRTRTYTGMPTIADFVSNIEGSKDDQAEYQYTVVLRAIRQTGNSGYPKFKDPVTQNLIDNRFGWSKVCGILEKDLGFFAREFKEAYRAYEKSPLLQIGNDKPCAKFLDMVKIKSISGGRG